MNSSGSFASKYKPVFDQRRDEWVLLVPAKSVKAVTPSRYEVRLPVYAGRALAIGGDILRPLREAYREWLLGQQGNKCAICGKGARAGDEWNLDHQPPLAQPNSRFIDYEKVTRNRVIHHGCDAAQRAKRR